LADAQAQLETADGELSDALAELEDGEREYADGLLAYEDGLQNYEQGRQELDDGWADYEDGAAELADARVTLDREAADARRQLADALATLNDGEADYADGLTDYADGQREAEEKLADGAQKLSDARAEAAEIEECQWYVLTRSANAGYLSYSMDADRMGNLATVFPLIFFLVAALVCLTTMTRMVEEQRTAIGGMKAMGFSKGAIAVKYVGYGFLASAIGAAVGLAVGLSLLPWIICTAWTILYTVGEICYSLEPVTSLLACLAAIGTVTLSALAACFSTLTEVPAQLMRPKAPPAGKRVLLERIGPVWRRLSFNHKITIRNLFRYQKRFWMTVVGIGGCAALIVTAFGLRDSIFDVMDKQYDEIYRYTVQVGLVDQVTDQELAQVAQALDESALVNDWLLCRSETVTAETASYTVDAHLQVVDSQQALERFVNLRHRTDDDPVTLPDDGVVLTEKLANLLGLSPGDTVTLEGDRRVSVTVADITEQYIQHYIYMTADCYQALFGKAPADNLVLVDYPAETAEGQALDTQLVALDGVTSLSLISDTRKTFTSSLESVDYAVLLIIVCAAALAFVVLFNLTNINITERLRELATLKVLGFYDGELSAYIYRENVVLTVFGVALGMVLGKLLHQWLIRTVEIDLLMFGRFLKAPSYGWAILLTLLFSLLVNLAAHWKLKKLDMVESLKSVE
jgi:putative ABC transport system permease protein